MSLTDSRNALTLPPISSSPPNLSTAKITSTKTPTQSFYCKDRDKIEAKALLPIFLLQRCPRQIFVNSPKVRASDLSDVKIALP